jgi:hypothetical protein
MSGKGETTKAKRKETHKDQNHLAAVTYHFVSFGILIYPSTLASAAATSAQRKAK